MSSSTSTSGAASSSGPLAPAPRKSSFSGSSKAAGKQKAPASCNPTPLSSGGSPEPLRPPPEAKKAPGEGGPWFSSLGGEQRGEAAARKVDDGSFSIGAARQARQAAKTEDDSIKNLPKHMLQPRTSHRPRAGEEAAARERAAKFRGLGRKNDSATSVGSVEEEVKEVLGIPGRMPGPQGGSFGSASGGRRRARRESHEREKSEIANSSGRSFGTGSSPSSSHNASITIQRIGSDISVGTGSQPGSYLELPGGSWGALPRVGSCASDRYNSSTNLNSNNASSIGWSNPSSNHASCSCLHPQWGGSGAGERPSVRGDDSYALPAYQGNRNESFRGIKLDRLSFRGPGAYGDDDDDAVPIDFSSTRRKSQYSAKRAEALRAEAMQQQKAEEGAAASGGLRQMAEAYTDDSLLKVERDLLIARMQSADLTDEASAHDMERLMEVQKKLQQLHGPTQQPTAASLSRTGSSNRLQPADGGGGASSSAAGGRYGHDRRSRESDASEFGLPGSSSAGRLGAKPRDAGARLAARLDSLSGKLDDAGGGGGGGGARRASKPAAAAAASSGERSVTPPRGAAARLRAKARLGMGESSSTPALPSAEQPKAEPPAPKALNRKGSKWMFRGARD